MEPAPGGDIATQISTMQITLDDLDVTVERLDEAIRGNGRPGLTTQMALADSRLKAVEDFVLEFHAIKRWIILSVAGLFGSLGWNVIEWYLATKP